MSSREAIKRLLFEYSRAQDSADFDALGRLFAHAAFQSTSGAEWRGEELAERRRSNLNLRADGTPGTKHLTTNIMIDVDEARGSAEARSYFLILRKDDKGPLQAIGAGRYHDRFEHAGGAWRFAHRRAYLDLEGGLEHFRREAPPASEATSSLPGAMALAPMPQPPDSREAIETLIYTYAERIDLADFDGVGRLFAHGWFRGGAGTLHGEQVVAEGLRSAIRVYPDGTLRTKHVNDERADRPR